MSCLVSKSITALIGNFNNLMIYLLLLFIVIYYYYYYFIYLFFCHYNSLTLPLSWSTFVSTQPVSTEFQFLRSQVKLFVFYCLDTSYPLTSHGVRMRIQSDSLLPQHCYRWHCQ